jgi:superfamily II DNA or RNA helicase
MTDKTFITNEDGQSLKERFVSLIKDTKYFDVLVGYFYTSGFKSIYKSLEPTEKIRILIGISTNRQTVELINQAKQIKSHHQIEQEFSNLVKNELEESPDNIDTEESVKKFVEWISSKKIELRAYPEETIHSKLYIMTFGDTDRDKGRVITGSSNFTQNGLVSNIEFNVELKNVSDYEFAKSQFEKLWAKGVDVSEKYIETIQKDTWLKEDITPYELYLKFLYEHFKEEINQEFELNHKFRPANFKELKYQDHAVINAKRIIDEYGGVFLSDVVGLGKTYMGTMLCQELNGRTLILAPPHLIDEKNQGSWENAFHDFGFRARDYKCRSIGILDRIIERKEHLEFENILIDESHRFRTEDTQTYALLSQICAGKKVILVTATPYNNSPKDLLSQIKLFQEVRDSTLPNMPDIESFFKRLEGKLKGLDRQNDKEEYLRIVKENSKLIREKVLKYLMVRRTRKEIMEYYGEDLTSQNMKFPNVAEPRPVFYEFNELESQIFSETLKDLTQNFTYARYSPILYLKDTSALGNLDRMSQTNMTKFMKILLIKRLESSFYAFKLTIDRFISSYTRFIDQYNKGEVYISKKYANKIYDYIDQGNFEAIDELINEDKADLYKSDQFTSSFIENLEADLKVLKVIQANWKKITRDPKVIAFKEQLTKESPVTQGKVLIFSESEETAGYLAKELQDVYPNKILYFSGKSSHQDREVVLENFDANSRNPKNDFKLLITTDILAEGVNLHRSNVVINYDIPWNPTRIMQRVGRINRVDTKHDEIYTYTFFPTDESDDQIKLKSSAESKIAAFIALLGADAKLLTDNEEIEAHNLFIKLISKESLEGDEETNSEIGYLQEIRKVRDENPKLFQQIKQLPKKCRASRKSNQPDGLITYLRKGRLHKFFFVQGSTDPEEKDFIEAASLLKADLNVPRSTFTKNYYELLEKNISILDKTLEEDLSEYKSKRGSQDNATKLIKLLRAKNIRGCEAFTENDDEYIDKVIMKLEAGALPKAVIKKTLEAVTQNEMILNPVKLLNSLKNNIPSEFLTKNEKIVDSFISDQKQVILSEFFKSIN